MLHNNHRPLYIFIIHLTIKLFNGQTLIIVGKSEFFFIKFGILSVISTKSLI